LQRKRSPPDRPDAEGFPRGDVRRETPNAQTRRAPPFDRGGPFPPPPRQIPFPEPHDHVTIPLRGMEETDTPEGRPTAVWDGWPPARPDKPDSLMALRIQSKTSPLALRRRGRPGGRGWPLSPPLPEACHSTSDPNSCPGTGGKLAGSLAARHLEGTPASKTLTLPTPPAYLSPGGTGFGGGAITQSRLRTVFPSP